MLFFLFLLIIEGNLLISTSSGILIEKSEFFPFIIKDYTIFSNFSHTRELKKGDKLIVEYEYKNLVPIALKIEKKSFYFSEPRFEIEENLVKESTFEIYDLRQEDFEILHIPNAKLYKNEKKDGAIFYGNNTEKEFKTFQNLLKIGLKNLFFYSKGIEGWNNAGNFFITEPNALVKRGKDLNFIIIDIRSEVEREGGAIPFAYYKEIEKFKWEDFSLKLGMPPILFYGQDEKDERAKIAAEKIINWRFQSEELKDGYVSILNGGVKKLKEEGFKLEKVKLKEFKKEHLKSEGELWEEDLDLLKEGYVFVDLRDEEDFIFKNSLKIPLSKLDEKIKDIPKTKEIVLFCYEGKRARIAYEILKNLKYKVKYLNGFFEK